MTQVTRQEEEVSEASAVASGLIVIYMIFMGAAIWAGSVGIGWGILGILIMVVLTYAITPAYPSMIEFYNYLFFALLVLSAFAALFGLWSSFIPGLMVVLGPLMIVGIPVGHIFYLVAEERREAAARRPKHLRGKKVKPPTIGEEIKEQEASVGGRISRRFALVCGYETLSAKKALGYLLSRTVLTWIIGSLVLALLAYLGVFG